MVFIDLKIFIAIVISAIPFVISYYIRNTKKKTLQKSQMTLTNNAQKQQQKTTDNDFSSSSFFGRYFYNLHPCRFYEGLRHYESFRKFLHLMLAFSIAFIQLIDLQAVTDVSRYVVDNHLQGDDAAVFFQQYGSFMTYPLATFGLFIFDLFLFWYRPTDRMLNLIHSNKRFVWCFGVLALVFLFYSPRCINISEAMLLVLIATYFYPPISEDYTPKARDPFPIVHKLFRKAA